MGVLTTVAGTLAGGLARMFTRRRTVADEDGAEREVRTVRPFPASMAVLVVFLLLYHLLLWPVLNYHFPEYGFPPLDFSLLGAILPALGGM